MPKGKVAVVPDDGLTMRERRTRPLLVVHTGDGKGKSTAAFGLALRAWSAGWPVGVFQFTKSPKWRVGEEAALKALGEVHDRTGQGGPVTWHKMGAGWSWLRTQPGDHARAAREGWEQVKRDLAAETYRLVVLDEFTYPIASGVTGRRAHPALVDAADLVTDMTKVKHPMDAGRKGQAGIEW
jgi:cob(I)alamin adenosyltransferase